MGWTFLAPVTLTHLRHCTEIPVIFGLSKSLWERGRRIDEHVIELISSGFEHADGHVWVLGETGGDDQTCCTAAEDEVVILVTEEVFGRRAKGGKVSAISSSIDTVGCHCGR
jgi:hypothetical protein